jgi:hypothetical protein
MAPLPCPLRLLWCNCEYKALWNLCAGKKGMVIGIVLFFVVNIKRIEPVMDDLLIQASFLSKSASKFVLQLGAVSLASRAPHPCHSA